MKNENPLFKKYVKPIVVAAVIASSASGIFVSSISAPPIAIGFWRLAVGVPFFAVPVFAGKRAELLSVSKKDLLLSGLSGIFLFLHFFTWFNAVKMTDIASAVVIAALHPLVVLLVSLIVFKQKVSVRAFMGILLALLGGAMIAGFDYRNLSGDNFRGDVFAFFAALFMGFYFLVGNEVRERVEGSVYVLLVFTACLICFAVAAAFTGTHLLGYPASDYVKLLFLALICQVGAHAVFNLCIGYVDSLYVSTWETGESVFATILGIIFLSQFPTAYQVIGCIVVLIGLLYYNYHQARDQSK